MPSSSAQAVSLATQRVSPMQGARTRNTEKGAASCRHSIVDGMAAIVAGIGLGRNLGRLLE
ncbi:MAG TPA: hypothetical protein VGN43_03155 [Steroidobacteraceae bacterium]|nr:hypothetical protein [Steroidobacteraceae bacterium]